MGKWQTLRKSTGINVRASFQLAASEPIVELTRLPTIRHDDIALFSCWRPPSKEFSRILLFSVTWRRARSHRRSQAELQSCFRALLRPARPTAFPGRGLAVRVSYSPALLTHACQYRRTHADSFKHVQHVGMQAHAYVEHILSIRVHREPRWTRSHTERARSHLR